MPLFSRSGNFEVAMEKLISLDSGSHMLALQAFMVFAEMPSIPVAFFTLDFSMRISILSGEIGLKSKVCAFSNFEQIDTTLGCVSISSGARTLPMSPATFA